MRKPTPHSIQELCLDQSREIDRLRALIPNWRRFGDEKPDIDTPLLIQFHREKDLPIESGECWRGIIEVWSVHGDTHQYPCADDDRWLYQSELLPK